MFFKPSKSLIALTIFCAILADQSACTNTLPESNVAPNLVKSVPSAGEETTATPLVKEITRSFGFVEPSPLSEFLASWPNITKNACVCEGKKEELVKEEEKSTEATSQKASESAGKSEKHRVVTITSPEGDEVDSGAALNGPVPAKTTQTEEIDSLRQAAVDEAVSKDAKQSSNSRVAEKENVDAKNKKQNGDKKKDKYSDKKRSKRDTKGGKGKKTSNKRGKQNDKRKNKGPNGKN